MHVVAANIILWIRTLIKESLEEIEEYEFEEIEKMKKEKMEVIMNYGFTLLLDNKEIYILYIFFFRITPVIKHNNVILFLKEQFKWKNTKKNVMSQSIVRNFYQKIFYP